jgi:hypothetical protein
LNEVVRAFTEHDALRRIDPYVKRRDETLVVEGSSPAEMLVNLRLDELVHMLWKQKAFSH